jgi:hypothetical protein
MPMKQTGRKVHRSMQGKQVDMDLLRQRNELTPAVGNARVNARGDELGPGGQIIRKREEVLRDYYAEKGGMPEELAVRRTTAAQAEVDANGKDVTEDWIEPSSTPAPKAKTAPTRKKTDEWVEDEDGNFVQKGE